MTERIHLGFAVEQPTKTCPRCGVEKPWSGFYKQRDGNRVRPSAYCRPCTIEYGRLNPPPPTYLRRYRLKYTYGLTPEQVDEMFAAQGGKCAICKTETAVVIDHCHTTNKVRALLCQTCNKVLGFVRDDPARLRLAADYLEGHQ